LLGNETILKTAGVLRLCDSIFVILTHDERASDISNHCCESENVLGSQIYTIAVPKVLPIELTALIQTLVEFFYLATALLHLSDLQL
jgi:hypothetical protein